MTAWEPTLDYRQREPTPVDATSAELALIGLIWVFASTNALSFKFPDGKLQVEVHHEGAVADYIHLLRWGADSLSVGPALQDNPPLPGRRDSLDQVRGHGIGENLRTQA